jgi:tRNA pseudouridine38-40 synthase
MERRIALLLEYDGTAYAGSQYQRNAPTIQAAVEAAIGRLTGERVRLALAGRTDAGVHAKGQVASFLTKSGHPPSAFLHGLNHYLPEDIAVVAAAEVPLGLDVRRHGRRRWYRYTICLRPGRPVLLRRYAWHLRGPLDVEAMARAAPLLEGEHDFAAFTQPAMAGRRTVRRVYRCQLWRKGQLLLLDMEANAFLPQQVRRTVGALVALGQGRLSLEGFRRLLAEAPPGAATWAAPPRGLCLMRVYYDNEIFGLGEASDEGALPPA